MRSLRNISILGLVSFVAALGGLTLVHGSAAVRPAQEMLTWGDQFFPYPTWLGTIEERANEVLGTWERPGMVVHKRQLPDFRNTAIANIDKIVTTSYIGNTMVNYQSWQLLQRCILNGYLVIELSAKTQTGSFQARFWVWADNSDWNEVFAAFPISQPNELEALASEMFNQAASCPGSDFSTPGPRPIIKPSTMF